MYYSRGTVYEMLGKNKIAIEDLTKAIELKPDYEDAYYNRAQAYKAAGKTQLAKRDLARVKELKAQPKPTPSPPEQNKEKSP
jgi:tetratricopeptide (TPR) repeat protein